MCGIATLPQEKAIIIELFISSIFIWGGGVVSLSWLLFLFNLKKKVSHIIISYT
jgi:hypothetical protein